MLPLGYPKVNLQVSTSSGEEEMLAFVGEALDSVVDQEELERSSSSSMTSVKEMAFQELFELAQRKLLRQISRYCPDDSDPYPRLFVVDLTTPEDDFNTAVNALNFDTIFLIY